MHQSYAGRARAWEDRKTPPADRLRGECAMRVRFRDVKPYDIVDSLDDLRGPTSGAVVLPRSVLWVGDGEVDLDRSGGARMVYQAVLAEGTSTDMETFLNRDLLVSIWPALVLDERLRSMWEERFPQLRADRFDHR